MASRHSAFLRKFYKEIGSFRTSQISLPLRIIGTSNGGVRTYIVRGPGPQNILRGQVSWVGGFCSIHPVRNRWKKNYQLLLPRKFVWKGVAINSNLPWILPCWLICHGGLAFWVVNMFIPPAGWEAWVYDLGGQNLIHPCIRYIVCYNRCIQSTYFQFISKFTIYTSQNAAC